MSKSAIGEPVDQRWRPTIVSERILVVDDEPGVVAACVRTLVRAGYTTEGVGDGLTALDRLQQEGFDLLLADLRMPGQDGLELLAQVKELDPHLAVVMITGYGTMDDALRAIRLGAHGFLLKPFDPDELVEAVQDSLRRRALIRDSLRLQILLPLLEINEALCTTNGAVGLTQRVIEVALRETGASRLQVVMKDPASGKLTTVASVGDLAEGEVPTAAVEHVFKTGASVWIEPDGHSHSNSTQTQRILAMSRPLLVKDRVVGVLNAEKAQGLPPFSQIGLELLSLLSGQLAIAIENVELHQQQQALRAFNEDIIETMTNGLVVVDEVGKVTAFNKAAATLLGYEATEVLGKTLRDSLLGASALAQMIQPVLQRCGSTSDEDTSQLVLDYQHGEVSVRHKDGNLLPLAVSASPLHDSSGYTTGVVCLFEDLSEAKALEAERRRLDRLAALGEMAAVVAHEIRNPMAGIAAGIEYLTKNIPEGSLQKEGVAMILGEIQRVNSILEDILSVARPFQLTLSPEAMPDIMESVLRRCQTSIEAKTIQVARHFAAPLPPVHADRERLEQALTNLVLNAIQAMSAGGKLNVTLGADNKELRIAISDTGPGIPIEAQQRIYEPFFTTKAQGTGLGLAIARRVIEEHNGTIEVVSKLGKGTTFTIRLPLCP